jgi:hypothetical protein
MLNKITILALIGILALYSLELKAQDSNEIVVGDSTVKNKSKSGKKLIWGGNFMVLFKPVIVDISPTVGIPLSKSVILGLGIGGIYNREKFKDSINVRTILSGRFFTQIKLFSIFNGQIEYELMGSALKRQGEDFQARRWAHNPLVGGTLRIPVMKITKVNITALYNFNYQRALSPYPSPWIFRIGFSR